MRIPISLTANSDFNQYHLVIDYPVSYFRLDPCNQKIDAQLKEFSIRFEDQIIPLSLEEIGSWGCNNCVVEMNQEKQYLAIKSLNNDPILYTDSFNKYLPDNTSLISYDRLQPYIFILSCFLLTLPFIYLLVIAWKINYWSLILISILEAGIFIIIKNFSYFAQFFSHQLIGRQKVVSYANFIGYQTKFEILLIFSFIFLPILIIFIDYLFKLKKK